MAWRILIVDDEIPILLGFEDCFTRAGFDVTIASDGETALEAVRAHGFDACLIDLKLPDTDGLVLAQAILKRLPDARLIAITAYPDLFEFQTVRDAGFHGYFAKPVSAEAIVHAVEELIFQRNPEA